MVFFDQASSVYDLVNVLIEFLFELVFMNATFDIGNGHFKDVIDKFTENFLNERLVFF